MAIPSRGRSPTPTLPREAGEGREGVRGRRAAHAARPSVALTFPENVPILGAAVRPRPAARFVAPLAAGEAAARAGRGSGNSLFEIVYRSRCAGASRRRRRALASVVGFPPDARRRSGQGLDPTSVSDSSPAGGYLPICDIRLSLPRWTWGSSLGFAVSPERLLRPGCCAPPALNHRDTRHRGTEKKARATISRRREDATGYAGTVRFSARALPAQALSLLCVSVSLWFKATGLRPAGPSPSPAGIPRCVWGSSLVFFPLAGDAARRRQSGYGASATGRAARGAREGAARRAPQHNLTAVSRLNPAPIRPSAAAARAGARGRRRTDRRRRRGRDRRGSGARH